MTDTRGLAVQAIALSVLAGKVAERAGHVRGELAAALDVGDRKTAKLDNGVTVGSITYANGRVTARVVDEHAFTEWVLQQYPDEVIPLVRSSFRDAVLKATRDAGVPMSPDGNLDVPGIELRPGTPYLTAKPNADAGPLLLEAMRASALLAIEATPEPPDYDKLTGE